MPLLQTLGVYFVLDNSISYDGVCAGVHKMNAAQVQAANDHCSKAISLSHRFIQTPTHS